VQVRSINAGKVSKVPRYFADWPRVEEDFHALEARLRLYVERRAGLLRADVPSISRSP
jgi:hypothetical protein